RQAIAIQTERSTLVGPNNGLLTSVAELEGVVQSVVLAESRFHLAKVSSTFHGRDIFAPVAAHIHNGVSLADRGPPVKQLVTLDLPKCSVTSQAIDAQVIDVDRFGNAVSNLRNRQFDEWGGGKACEVLVKLPADSIRGISRTYSDVEDGQPLAYFNSSGRLEI